MTIEQFKKSNGGRDYFSVYHRFGSVLVTVTDMKADSKEAAIELSKKYLKKAIDETD